MSFIKSLFNIPVLSKPYVNAQHEHLFTPEVTARLNAEADKKVKEGKAIYAN